MENKEYTFKVMTCDTHETLGGRLYPKELIKKSIEEYIASHTEHEQSYLYGQVKSNNEWVTPNFEVDTALISHIIKDFVWKDSELFITIEPIDTVQGKLLQDVLEEYPQDELELSFNAYGEIENNVVTEATFVSFDFII